MNEALWISLALVALLTPAVVTDLRHHRIPNLLVFPFWLAAPLLHLTLSGTDAALSSLGGLVLAFALAFPLWIVGWFGAGDVKLIAAVGALTGAQLVWPMLAAVALSGAGLAALALLWKGALGRAMERIWASLALTVASRRGVYIEAQGEDADIRLPYAIAIACGTSLVWLHHLGVLQYLN